MSISADAQQLVPNGPGGRHLSAQRPHTGRRVGWAGLAVGVAVSGVVAIDSATNSQDAGALTSSSSIESAPPTRAKLASVAPGHRAELKQLFSSAVSWGLSSSSTGLPPSAVAVEYQRGKGYRALAVIVTPATTDHAAFVMSEDLVANASEPFAPNVIGISSDPTRTFECEIDGKKYTANIYETDYRVIAPGDGVVAVANIPGGDTAISQQTVLVRDNGGPAVSTPLVASAGL